MKLKVVQITTDARLAYQKFNLPEPYFGTAPQALFEGFSYIDDIELHVISCSSVEMHKPRKLAHNIYFHQPIVGKLGWGKSLFLGCAQATRKLLKEIQPDIVHGQGTERDCAMAAVLSGYPNIITLHGNMRVMAHRPEHRTSFYYRLAAILETFCLKRTSGVVSISKYTQNLVKGLASKNWLIPNAIRSVFIESPAIELKKTIPTIINVGVISPRKMQLEILQMIAEIINQGKKLHIVFAGDHSDNNQYGAAFASELQKAERAGYASFVGFLNASALINALDEAHGFLHFPTEEAFGLVVAEALARGLKFFGSNLGGIVDIAAGIEGAELHNDIQSLKAGIIKWIDAGAQQPAGASASMASRYHPKVIAQRHVEIYQEVLGKF